MKINSKIIYLIISFIISMMVNFFQYYINFYAIYEVTQDTEKFLGNLFFSRYAMITYLTVTVICFMCFIGIEKCIKTALEKVKEKEDPEENN